MARRSTPEEIIEDTCPGKLKVADSVSSRRSTIRHAIVLPCVFAVPSTSAHPLAVGTVLVDGILVSDDAQVISFFTRQQIKVSILIQVQQFGAVELDTRRYPADVVEIPTLQLTVVLNTL